MIREASGRRASAPAPPRARVLYARARCTRARARASGALLLALFIEPLYTIYKYTFPNDVFVTRNRRLGGLVLG